ncbi:MAG: peptidoglycan-binding protein [Ignavibacteriae bacterium]|nr:peptidoglycan-binding protein [Ignavibacteriota bacterium]MCB9216316.1 peptidoglycan-binding protein [Ignavibacteria bacterium]
MKTLRLYDGYQNTSPHLRDEVKKLQNLLGLSEDGLFGPNTEKAVIAFQKQNKLETDGIVGPRTWAKLLGEVPLKKGNFPTTYGEGNQRLLKQLKAVQENYLPFVEEAAKRAGVPPSVICGIGSRESEWGLSTALDKRGPGGKGDHGHGRGLMQIDDRYHAFARTGKWDNAEANILYAAKVLISSRAYIAKRYTLDDKTLLRATLAAYNCGPGNVAKALAKGRDIDFYTTGRDYGANVLDRAGWFQTKGID